MKNTLTPLQTMALRIDETKRMVEESDPDDPETCLIRELLRIDRAAFDAVTTCEDRIASMRWVHSYPDGTYSRPVPFKKLRAQSKRLSERNEK